MDVDKKASKKSLAIIYGAGLFWSLVMIIVARLIPQSIVQSGWFAGIIFVLLMIGVAGLICLPLKLERDKDKDEKESR